MDVDKIICSDALKLDKLIPKNSVDLTIIIPPYHSVDTKPSKHINLIKKILKQTAKVTKIGGICCLVVSDDINVKQGAMDVTQTLAFYEAKDDPHIRKKWVFDDEIKWIKSPKAATMSSDFAGLDLVSFDETPFSSIELFVRSNSGTCEELNISKRINKLKISQSKKKELNNSFWYIQPRSERGFKDYFPKELIIRLIMLFSEKGDVILDPFSGHGITAVAAKTLSRHYLCFEKDLNKVKLAKKRIKSSNRYTK